MGEKCMDYEVERVRCRGRWKKTWSEVVEKDSYPTNTEEGVVDCGIKE